MWIIGGITNGFALSPSVINNFPHVACGQQRFLGWFEYAVTDLPPPIFPAEIGNKRFLLQQSISVLYLDGQRNWPGPLFDVRDFMANFNEVSTSLRDSFSMLRWSL